MTLLSYSSFQKVLFPETTQLSDSAAVENLFLQRVVRFLPDTNADLATMPIVVFDFETTGLDPREDHIIEIGAVRLVGNEVLEEYSTLINPGVQLNEAITKITGITSDELTDAPPLKDVLPSFLKFIDGAVLVAHNAEFDMGFLSMACSRNGIQIQWPCFCTLKMARAILPDLPSKNLDSLAQHYQLKFEARHRSLGDVKVTTEVVRRFFEETKSSIAKWIDLKPFVVDRR